MLSGGLAAELLPEAVRISGASCLDVFSGVERRQGDEHPGYIRASHRRSRRRGADEQ
jgi:phosphoribosylanthranilate isomerase